MTAKFFASATKMYIHLYFSNKHSKPGAKNQISIKHMLALSHSLPNKKKIASVIIQHPEQQVAAMPWLMALYMKKWKNSSIKWDPYISIHLKSNPEMKKTVLPTSPQQQVLMHSLRKTLNKWSRNVPKQKFKIKQQKQQ